MMGSRDVLKHPGDFYIQDKYNAIKNGSAIKQPRFDLYVFYGYKICLVVVPAAILFFVNWMCKAAVRVELDATAMAELTKVNHFSNWMRNH